MLEKYSFIVKQMAYVVTRVF